ncbi:MAG: PilZ domain-containing protein [Candidatus Eisenbacteria bacterium]|uniref:PilZ domain-containing protein n=1 Tax=Eiseniibacteriota bacterium TaxID=2212470 RepID=A0A956RMW8_UNCEI|nr:PilZ domain-containing protein [Candidatus Eisenbacteria bacterium]
MADLDLDKLLHGEFGDWVVGTPVETTSIPGTSPTVAWALRSDYVSQVDLDAISDLAQSLCDRGEFLRALTVLKLVHRPDEDEGFDATGIVQKMLGCKGPDSTDPLPAEFLGTRRERLAFSVFERDVVEFIPAPREGAKLPGKYWFIAHDNTPREGAPRGLLMLWNARTEVAGAVRPAGKRLKARRKLRLRSELAVLRPDAREAGPIRMPAEVIDISPTGCGIRVSDTIGRLRGLSLVGMRARFQVRANMNNEVLSSLAWIRWVSGNDPADMQIGLEFLEPPPEFRQGVERLLTVDHGDLRYLWSLWDAEARTS